MKLTNEEKQILSNAHTFISIGLIDPNLSPFKRPAFATVMGNTETIINVIIEVMLTDQRLADILLLSVDTYKKEVIKKSNKN